MATPAAPALSGNCSLNPVSLASNNSTGTPSYTSAAGSGANTSAYVGTQQLSMLPACSSSGFGKIEKADGTTKFGGTTIFTLPPDVDVHSEIFYNYAHLAPFFSAQY